MRRAAACLLVGRLVLAGGAVRVRRGSGVEVDGGGAVDDSAER